jgi:hydroxyethylthiazole kinase-like uncharacterized protein yjeF
MSGALQLAARASLCAGAGRVYATALAEQSVMSDSPEVMQRSWTSARSMALAEHATVVCGCGGGDPVRHVLPELLARSTCLVLDADALNAVAADPALSALLAARGRRAAATVLTPHPLEAARLLDTTASIVQSDRLSAARTLAQRFNSVVLLKGSGTVIAAPGQTTVINPTGNARLATAGTGDVLAGWIGGCWSGHEADDPCSAAVAATGAAWLHGLAVQDLDAGLPLPAHRLIDAMASTAASLC